MRIYTNSLGITCVEPAEGYLLKKNEETYKKVYLGINDRADLYEEVVDESYMNINKEEESESINISSNMILVSPNGKRFKLVVNNDGSLTTKEM